MELALEEWMCLYIYVPHNVSMILVNTLETITMGSLGSKSWGKNALSLAAVTKAGERGGSCRGWSGKEAAFQPEDLWRIMGGKGRGHLGHGQFLERMHLPTRDRGLGTFPLVSTAFCHFRLCHLCCGNPKPPQMLVSNEGGCMLPKEVTAVRNVPLSTFWSWEGALASQGACETSERGSPPLRAAQSKWMMLCAGDSVCGQRTIQSFFYLFITSPSQPALISHSHFIFKRAFRNLSWISQLLLRLIGWTLNTFHSFNYEKFKNSKSASLISSSIIHYLKTYLTLCSS